jgi:group I intron endonuclease
MDKMITYTVYMHECPDGKKYIGLTTKEPETRFGKNGILYKKNKRFYTAIQEFGWDNFKHIILLETTDREKAAAKEIEMIAFYKTNIEKYGFNITKGGDFHIHTSETKEKMSVTRKGKALSDAHKKSLSKSKTGATFTEEHKEHLRQAHIGKKLDEEHKRHISESCKGKGTRAVLQIDDNGNVIKTFNSIREALEAVNPRAKRGSNISEVCKGLRPKAYGYKWEYADKAG